MQSIETIRLSTRMPDARARAVEILQRGELIAFPTDTVYGVGAHGFRSEAIAQLYTVKDRPLHLPIPLLLPNVAAMEAVCIHIPSLAWNLAERFWPGALSLVLPRASTVPDTATAGGATVAIRVPAHSLVRELCRQLGAPLAATSANRHGQPPPLTADEVEAELGGRIPMLLDGGPCPGGVASTVLDLTTSPPTLLRSGPVTIEELSELVPEWATTR